MLIAALCTGVLLAQQPAPRVVVTNPAYDATEQLVRVSVPWPRGRHLTMSALRIGDDVAPCVTLERWPDGSVALVQAHTRVSLDAAETRTLDVVPAELEPGTTGPWIWPDDLPLRSEVVDPWGRAFHAELAPDPRCPIETRLSSHRIRVRRLRGIHTREEEGARAGFLIAQGWLTEFAGERRAELTLVLSNDPLPDEPTPGPVRFREFALCTTAPAVRVRPRFAVANLLAEPVRRSDGTWRQSLLGPSDQLYLGDRTGKSFRFDLYLDASPADADARTAARQAVEHPVFAVPELEWTRHTGAFGAHGGPAPATDPEPGLGTALVQAWRGDAAQRSGSGPFGDLGDHRDAAAQGSPRNGSSALHNVLRWRSPVLLRLAEAAVLQQTLRPTPATAPRLPDATEPWRTGMSPRAIEHPHGWTSLDYEHFSVDLLHDFYWLTGDPLARHELARAGTGLLPLLSAVPFRTSRGEGNCLQAGILIDRATGDRQLTDALLARVRELVIPGLGAACAVPQPPHRDALGSDEPFDAPWQMAALVRGLHALWRATGADDVRAAVTSVATAMATEGFVDDVGPKSFVSARDPATHALPVGHEPHIGTAWMLIDAFVLAAEAATPDESGELFEQRADFLVRNADAPEGGGVLAHPWFQLWFDRHPPDR